jgi:hypothetical protein
MRAGDPAAIDDICTLLAHIQARALESRDGGLSQESLERLTPQLLDSDTARAGFLCHIAQAAGFCHQEGRSFRLHRERVRNWFKQARADQLQALQDAWTDDVTWNDLWHVPGIRCEETGWRNDPVLARKNAMALLSRCRTDTWFSLPGYIEAVHREMHDFARPDGDFESWYIRDARSGEYLMGLEQWERVEGALLRYLLCGPLHWLGIVSLGYQEGWEKPSFFRITPWGAAYLGLSHASLEGLPPQAARVAPDGRVTLARETPLSDRFQLSRIADWRASGAEYVYEMTPSSIGRAFGADIPVERVERFLQRISQGNLPAAAIARIRNWARRYGHVRLRRVSILETRTPRLMAELRANGRIRGYLRQVLSPTMALVRESDWTLLTRELSEAGYLPEIVERE